MGLKSAFMTGAAVTAGFAGVTALRLPPGDFGPAAGPATAAGTQSLAAPFVSGAAPVIIAGRLTFTTAPTARRTAGKEGEYIVSAMLANLGCEQEKGTVSAVAQDRNGEPVILQVNGSDSVALPELKPGSHAPVSFRLTRKASNADTPRAWWDNVIFSTREFQDPMWQGSVPIKATLILTRTPSVEGEKPWCDCLPATAQASCSAKDSTATSVSQVTLQPPVPSSVEQHVFGLSALAALVVTVLSVRFQWGKLCRRMGTPRWSLTDSTASNLTVLGGLLIGISSFTGMPAEGWSTDKASYALLGVIFTAFLGFGPTVFKLFESSTTGSPTGPVWAFVVAGGFTTWGAVGQLLTLKMTLAEFAGAGVLSSSSAVVLQLLSLGLCAALCYYAVVTNKDLASESAISPERPAELRVEATQPPATWPLL
ncbi:MAG: hypothetical protein SGI92_16045 [Bryobacteraceae bacterium]|nr:hypothetical protein [Bryobacteraceae bacterium]